MMNKNTKETDFAYIDVPHKTTPNEAGWFASYYAIGSRYWGVIVDSHNRVRVRTLKDYKSKAVAVNQSYRALIRLERSIK